MKSLILVIISLTLVSNAWSQKALKLKLNRLAHIGDRYEMILESNERVNNTMLLAESGELYNAEKTNTHYTVQALAEVQQVSPKGEESRIQYIISKCNRVVVRSLEGVGYAPETSVEDTLIAAGSTVVMDVMKGKKTFRVNAKEVSDSVTNLLKNCFEEGGSMDMDDMVKWKKERKAGEAWSIDPKMMTNKMNENTMTSLAIESARFRFDSLCTYDDIPCAAIHFDASISPNSIPFPDEFTKKLSDKELSFKAIIGSILPLDNSVGQQTQTVSYAMVLKGTIKIQEGVPVMKLAVSNEMMKEVQFKR